VAVSGPKLVCGAESWFRHRFIVPNLNGPSTGGTVFNAQLLHALSEVGLNAYRLDCDNLAHTLGESSPCCVWVDSLYLDHLRAIRRLSNGRHTVGLLAHYLPSLVREGALVERARLSLGEQYAIDASDAFIVTSPFMRQTLERLAEMPRRFLLIEPGCFSPRCTHVALSRSDLNAILVANLLPGKGIELFLRELADHVRAHDHFQLRIIGSKNLDLSYALACEDLIKEHPKLSQCVFLCGARHPSDVVEEMSLSNLVVSASNMETYGMALAEARTIGVPILAHAGGNVGAHVDACSGGELVRTQGELARAFLELSRNPSALMARVQAARQLASPPRSWFDAARDFVAQASLLAEVMLSQVQ